LATFDPFGVHPFTNTSGVLPPAPQPSQYPHMVRQTHAGSTHSSGTAPDGHNPQFKNTTSLKAPAPKRATKVSQNQTALPVWVPFRPETVTPEL
ncbi:hypothetical protein CONPUDRAFT_42737, partial [Coniophora puteana RWD-64-598 SS2]